ncbi:hypothetical protein EV363DRAFT_1438259, partial [Boletus edulis]
MSAENTQCFKNLQEQFGRFRILIVGRANAGKTTILRAICNTTENPEIYDGDGNKVDLSQIEGSMERGIHNVENELVFRSNDKLIFHDSRGFEAGSEEEFLQMKNFIADRAKTTILKKRIHAIWYCIPMDEIERAIQRSEERFFDECDPGNEIFDKADVWSRLTLMKYAPRSCVRIKDMHKSSNEGCSKLLDVTTNALNEEALQMLLVSAQEVNIALCVRCAVGNLIRDTDKVYNSLLSIANMSEQRLQELAWWFPHV